MEINRKQFGKMQYRAAFGPFLNVLNVLKLKIQEEHRDIIKGTPFWAMMCRKTYVDIIRIINCFIVETSEFKFGDRCEKLTGFEVEELFGLPNFGRDINLNERCSKFEEGFIKRNFKTVDRVTRQNIESAMITIVTGKTQQNREDFLCLMCLHLCITLLFCNSGSTISWNITSCCQDVRTMAGYNWAKATSDCLQKQLVKNFGKPSHVSGCVVLLPFWFCEISSLVEPVKGRMDLAPKFVKWDLQVLHEAMSAIEFDRLQRASESHMNRSLRCELHIMSKFRSYESQQPIAAHKSLAKNMTSSVTVASVTSEKKNFDVANHRLTTSVSGGSNFDEIRTKEVVSTTSKKEFNPSKMFQLISSQDNLFHKDAYNQYDDLLSDLTQLLECIEKEMGENKHASSPEIATWIVRLKRKQRKPKRLTGFVYDEMKSWREPKKAKLNEIVPSVTAQIGSEAIGRHTVKGKQRIGITLDPSCMSVWMYLSNEEQDRMHQYFLCADSG
ncbi:hypothetical protein D8674_000195 [Pyrus ussuriensis x Pyrus communis]|uniref:Uncharacterized protein n=1 Tax=Pyrus ussuriensis x Pyrus communis TaxID=2448454 RepID=A0A5N5F2R9_9ROSA|nr:hypothetical protein D8674_000195 [Pyrus ussuriensis x Pyrus communis]